MYINTRAVFKTTLYCTIDSRQANLTCFINHSTSLLLLILRLYGDAGSAAARAAVRPAPNLDMFVYRRVMTRLLHAPCFHIQSKTPNGLQSSRHRLLHKLSYKEYYNIKIIKPHHNN